MKRVLIFVAHGVGGAERMAVTITKSLDPAVYKVVYYLVDNVGDNKYSLNDFIPRHAERHFIKKSGALELLRKMYRVIKIEQPDIIFSSSYYLSNKLLLFKNLFRKATFIIRCENYLYTYTKLQQFLIRLTYDKADKIIVQTEEMKNEIVEKLHVGNDVICVLHNPVDIETIEAKVTNVCSPYSDPDKVTIIASGRFKEQKGFDLLIHAFSIVHQHVPHSELYILGETFGENNAFYQKVQNIISEYGLIDKVHCIGYQDNPYPYIKYADCFVLSSRYEGLPNVLIESLYLGTPVAAFDCVPVINRIVTNGENGYIAEMGDIESLAWAICNALKLGKIQSHYKSASLYDFHKLFSRVRRKRGRAASFLAFTKNKLLNGYLHIRRSRYIPYISLRLTNDTSIISSNCFAGRIMQDLKMEYNSPTLGLYFMYPDYVEFLKNLEFYLKKAEITFVDKSKYKIGNERRSNCKHWYPIGLLDNKVEIHFLHYHTEEEAAEKWYRRARRVNFDNLLIIGMEQNRCTINDIENFDALPFKRKIMFSSKEIEGISSNVYMKEFASKDEVGDAYRKGHLFYRYLLNRI